MGHISISPSDNSDDEFRDVVKREINRLAKERIDHDSLETFYPKEGIRNAISTIRVSLDTKRKLSKCLRPRETYDEVIRRIMEMNNQFKEEINYLKSIEKENKNLIKYIEAGFQRERKTLSFHPDLKIEYSFNQSKIKSHDDFSFNLEIDNFILQGNPVSEQKGIRAIQTIGILKSLKNIDLNSDTKEIIKRKELMLESEEEFIKTKYLIYFKLLFFIINGKMDKKNDESAFFDRDFWMELYDLKNLSSNALEEDVIQKLNKFKLELKQIKVDEERRLWNLKPRD